MKLSRINNILMYILIFFMIYSSALNYTYLPSAFSYLKDIIIFYFAIVLIINRKIERPKGLGKSFYILFLLIAIISWMGLINGTDNSAVEVIIRILRYLEFFILFFIFTNLEKICTLTYDKLINCYIVLSVVLIFVHLFGYFVPNNIVSIYIDNKIGNGYYRNRISVGQPAIAVYPMIISYLYLLIYNKNDFKTIINIILLLVGIIISISTTGILSIIVTTVMFLILNCNRKKLKKFIYIILLLSILFSIIFSIINSIPTLSELYEKQKNLLDIKISALYTDNVNDLSMETRDIKYEDVSKNITNPLQRILGLGLLGYNSNNINVGSLENTYRMMQVCYGIIGLIVFIMFLGKQIISEIKNIKTNDGLFILTLFIVFAMHSYTLEVFYLPTISYTLSLFYCYIKNGKKGEKNENINS